MGRVVAACVGQASIAAEDAGRLLRTCEMAACGWDTIGLALHRRLGSFCDQTEAPFFGDWLGCAEWINEAPMASLHVVSHVGELFCGDKMFCEGPPEVLFCTLPCLIELGYDGALARAAVGKMEMGVRRTTCMASIESSERWQPLRSSWARGIVLAKRLKALHKDEACAQDASKGPRKRVRGGHVP